MPADTTKLTPAPSTTQARSANVVDLVTDDADPDAIASSLLVQVAGLSELEYLLHTVVGATKFAVHAVWNAAGHPRSLLYRASTGSRNKIVLASPPYFGCALNPKNLLHAAVRDAVSHLALHDDQMLAVSASVPPCTMAGERGPRMLDVIVIAHDNIQARQWASATTAYLKQPRWLTAEMVELDVDASRFEACPMPRARMRILHALAFAHQHNLCMRICHTGPAYEVGKDWPQVAYPGTYTPVLGTAPPDMGSHQHRFTQSAPPSVVVPMATRRVAQCAEVHDEDDDVEEVRCKPLSAKKQKVSADKPTVVLTMHDKLAQLQQQLDDQLMALTAAGPLGAEDMDEMQGALRAVWSILRNTRPVKTAAATKKARAIRDSNPWVDGLTGRLRSQAAAVLNSLNTANIARLCPDRTLRTKPSDLQALLRHAIASVTFARAVRYGMHDLVQTTSLVDGKHRSIGEMDAAFSAVRTALAHVRVNKHVFAFVGMQGVGKTTIIEQLSHILATHGDVGTLLEDVNGFADALGRYLAAVNAAKPLAVIQPLAYEVQLAVWASHLKLIDGIDKPTVVERCAVCTFAFSLVLFFNKHLSPTQLTQLCTRFSDEGYLPVGVTLLEADPAVCRDRVASRASLDPSRKAEATSPLAYFEQLGITHLALAALPELRQRVTVLVRHVPDRGTDPDGYEGKVQDHFAAVIDVFQRGKDGMQLYPPPPQPGAGTDTAATATSQP